MTAAPDFAPIVEVTVPHERDAEPAFRRAAIVVREAKAVGQFVRRAT